MIAVIILSEQIGDHAIITENESESLLTRINAHLAKWNAPTISVLDMFFISFKRGYSLLSDGKTKISIQ